MSYFSSFNKAKPIFCLLLNVDWYSVSGIQSLIRMIKCSVTPERGAADVMENLRKGWHGALSEQRLKAPPFAINARFGAEKKGEMLYLCDALDGWGPFFTQFKAAMCRKVGAADANRAFAEIMKIVNEMEAKLFALDGVHNRKTFEEQFEWEKPITTIRGHW